MISELKTQIHLKKIILKTKFRKVFTKEEKMKKLKPLEI